MSEQTKPNGQRGKKYKEPQVLFRVPTKTTPESPGFLLLPFLLFHSQTYSDLELLNESFLRCS